MANESSSRGENAHGRFFVDDTCISCAACWKAAPNHITNHPVEMYAYFSEQPKSSEELEVCLKAKNICPVNAIGLRSHD